MLSLRRTDSATTRSVRASLLLVVFAGTACGRAHGLAGTPSARDAGPDGSLWTDAAIDADAALARWDNLAAAAGSAEVSPDLRSLTCGNGILDEGETCDDGNTSSGDGCDSLCRFECFDFDCSPPSPGSHSRLNLCGDAWLGPPEVCDDGNVESGDGCSSNCRAVETGYRCPVPGRLCVPVCGDRAIAGMETCDDGNSLGGDGCSEFCYAEPGWNCASGTCVRLPLVDAGEDADAGPPRCGNGIREGAEECDEGSSDNDRDRGGCGKNCRYLYCGDGTVSGDEECDLGTLRNVSIYGTRNGCNPYCKRTPYCGDGILDVSFGEDCDWGDQNVGPRMVCTLRCQYVVH